jgi:predicted transcriptional regulator
MSHRCNGFLSSAWSLQTDLRRHTIKRVAVEEGKVERIERPRLTNQYELTSEGKKIAQKLKEIEAMLEENDLNLRFLF